MDGTVQWRARLALAAVCALAPACSDPVRPIRPVLAISDAVHAGGTPGFFFLPPMVAAPTVDGAFDAGLAALEPEVVICDAATADTDCANGTALARFTRHTTPAITVDADAQQYHVNWNTRAAGFDAGQTYRLHVRAGAAGARRNLGYADVLLTDTPGRAKSLASGDVIVLADGQTLPVKFRIETRVVGAVHAGLSRDSVPTGASVSATATVLDLHGLPRGGIAVTWGTAGAPVTIAASTGATDGNGQHTTAVTAGAAAGQASIVVYAAGLADAVTLTLIPASLNLWEPLPEMPTRRSDPVVVASEGRLFVIGGHSGNVFMNTVEAFDPGSTSWAVMAPMPTARSMAGGGVIDGIIYVVGGTRDFNSPLAVVEAYDPRTNTWSTRRSLPAGRMALTVAVADGILYAIGGYRFGDLASVDAYDPATDTWSPRAPLPLPRNAPGAAAINGRLYVAGGARAGLQYSRSVAVYDPAIDSWTEGGSMPTPRYRLAVAALDGRLYALGGYYEPSGAYLSEVEAYDPATDTWTVRARMPNARYRLGAAVLNGVLYAVGGYSEGLGGALALIEAYRP